MANFDLHILLELRSGDGQLFHSENVAPNMYENCTFEAARETLIAYGYSPPDDEQLRQLVDPGSHGGEPWSVSQRAIAMLAPDLPTSIEFPDDVAGALRQYGAQGFVAHIGFWCDSQARIPAVGPVVASHAEVAIAADSTGITFKNVWPHDPYTLTDDLTRRLYDGGGILVFQRSLTGGFLMALSDLEQIELRDKLRQVWSQLCKDPVDEVGTSVTGMIENLYRRPAVDLAPVASALAVLEAELGALPGKLQPPAVTATAVVPPETLTPVLAAVAAAQAAIDSTRAGVDELLGHHAHGNVP